MNCNIEISKNDNPNAIGELLRGKFFKQNIAEGLYGCYSTFELNEGVEKLPYRKVYWRDRPDIKSDDECCEGDFTREEYCEKIEDEGRVFNEFAENEDLLEIWTRAELNGVIMEYFWDGDGFLQFIFPDGSILSNNDCKKSNRWEWS